MRTADFISLLLLLQEGNIQEYLLQPVWTGGTVPVVSAGLYHSEMHKTESPI